MTDINTSSDERKVTIPASMLTQPIANYGGYVATKCIACGAQGWEGQLQHKPECPVNAQPAAPAEVVAPDDEWRRLALQFDGHRMQALACIKALLNAPERHRAAAYEFLAAPPLSGEQVLADRIAALASPAQAPAAPSVGEPALARACDLLSMTIGTLMAHRAKIGYVDNSPIASVVAEAVEFLRPWPEKLPAAVAAADECPYCHACWPHCLHCDGTGLATPPAAPAATEAPSDPQLLKAYELGFLRAAEWVNRDDLRADLDSGAYAKDRARDLGPMLATPAPAVGASPEPSKGAYVDAFLCRAWGETELTSAEIVEGWAGVRAFMVREWLGEEDATNGDGGNTLDQLKADFDEHNEDQRGGAYTLEFEIGGVSVERVTGWAAVGASVQPVPASLSDEQVKREIEFAFASTNDNGHLSMYTYWFEKALRIGYRLATTSSAASEVKP